MTTPITGVIAATNGTQQLDGLIAHIQGTTARMLGPEPDEATAAVHYLVRSFVFFARSYFAAFQESLRVDKRVNADPRELLYQQHQAIEKLCTEWESLSPLICAVADPHIGMLKTIVSEARPSLYWAETWLEETRKKTKLPAAQSTQQAWANEANWPLGVITIPYFERHFELVRFSYAPDVFVTGVPIYDLEAPWDWQVVWHEMAGHVVRLLDEMDEIKTKILPKIDALGIWDNIREIYDRSRRRKSGSAAKLAIPAENGSTRRRPRASELSWDAINRADWIAELLEDAYSVLSLGPGILPTLARILQQHYRSDFGLQDVRHPPLRLRLDMARAIAFEMQPGDVALEQIGVSEDQLAAFEVLRPVAKILIGALEGDDKRPGYLRHKFDPARSTEIAVLKDRLIAGERIDGQVAIPDLIVAAGMAFEAQPDAASLIATSVTSALALTQAGAGVAAAAKRPAIAFPSPNEQQIVGLVKGKDWQDLLGETFQTVDFFAGDPQSHPQHQRKITLVFNFLTVAAHELRTPPSCHACVAHMQPYRCRCSLSLTRTLALLSRAAHSILRGRYCNASARCAGPI